MGPLSLQMRRSRSGAPANLPVRSPLTVDTFVRISPSESLNKLKRQITVVALIYPRSLWTPPSNAAYQRFWRKAVHLAEKARHRRAITKGQGISELFNASGEKKATPTNTISATDRKITFFVISGTWA